MRSLPDPLVFLPGFSIINSFKKRFLRSTWALRPWGLEAQLNSPSFAGFWLILGEGWKKSTQQKKIGSQPRSWTSPDAQRFRWLGSFGIPVSLSCFGGIVHGKEGMSFYCEMCTRYLILICPELDTNRRREGELSLFLKESLLWKSL